MSRPSRPHGHRKSHSTSALAFLAQGSTTPSTSTASSSKLGQSVRHSDGPPRETNHHKRRPIVLQPSLGSVAEADDRARSKGVAPSERKAEVEGGLVDIKRWLSEIRSLRSSDRRRLAALRNLERSFVACCSGSSPVTPRQFIALQALLALLTRHAHTLSQRASASHTTLSSQDPVAAILVPELTSIIIILQGLCLMDKRAKEDAGETWVLELFIDLLLVLRAQIPPEGEKPIDYCILDLLCCILVDSPRNARAFEELNGLEGVVRVLKGTGVAKEVRMKCIEFLYFYLLPENSPSQRVTSTSSSSSSSSNESNLYPPSPTPNDFDDVSLQREHRRSTSPDSSSGQPTHEYGDLDMSFVPQTPQKRPNPALGYLTPSTRRISGSLSATPSLVAIPASPRSVPPSPSSRRLNSMAEDDESMMLSPARSLHPGQSSQPPTPSARRRQSTTPLDVMREDEERNAGLGLGLPRSATSTDVTRAASGQNGMASVSTGNHRDGFVSPTFADPFRLSSAVSNAQSTGSSSGSSTVTPASRGISRSSTLPSLTISPDPSEVASDDSHDGLRTTRRTSVRRASKSPLTQVITPITDSPEQVHKSKMPRVRHLRTQSNLADMACAPNEAQGRTGPSPAFPNTKAGEAIPRQGKIRHSRTQSHMSGLSLPPHPHSQTSMPPPPIPISRRTSLTPPVPSFAHPGGASNRTTSSASATTSSSDTSTTPISKPTPTPARRAFPAELTKGLPSAVSSPNIHHGANSPLAPARRVPSGTGTKGLSKLANGEIREGEGKGVKGEVKTVEEKKKLLGMWLGNVDQLVQGVEKVSFWGSIGKR